MAKMYHYRIIPGDLSSTKVELTQEELYTIERELSGSVSERHQQGLGDTKRCQRDTAKLLSISWHCLGGNDPVQFTAKKKTIKGYNNVLLPIQFRESYRSYFFIEIMKMLATFNRTKGCWTQYVRWARGKALRSTFQYMKREQAHTELLGMLNEIVQNYGICCQVDSYSAKNEENDSNSEVLDEECKENFRRMDGRVGED